MRICHDCKIRWKFDWEDDKGRDCPKCDLDAFFTSNTGDIGTAMYLESTGTSLDEYKQFPENYLPEKLSFTQSERLRNIPCDDESTPTHDALSEYIKKLENN